MTRLIALFLAVCTWCAIQCPAFAAIRDAHEFTLPASQEAMILNQAMEPSIAFASGEPGQPLNIGPNDWGYSVLVSGLGQMVMGDPLRGLAFLGSMLLLVVGGGVLISNAMFESIGESAANQIGYQIGKGTSEAFGGSYSQPPPTPSRSGSGSGTFGMVMVAAGLGVYVWNIIDAYQMNQAKLGIQQPPAQSGMRSGHLDANLADGSVRYSLAF